MVSKVHGFLVTDFLVTWFPTYMIFYLHGFAVTWFLIATYGFLVTWFSNCMVS